MDEVHVLLVDHDSDFLISTAEMLELCSYKVTYVELASTALSMLSSGKSNFNLVMANINSPDMHGYKLLQQAVNMDIPVILMSVEDNAFLAMEALAIGALLCIEKPVTLEMLKYLWQHVAREKKGIYKEKERRMGTIEENNNMRGIEFRGEIEDEHNIIGSGNMKDKIHEGKKKISEPEYQIINNKVKRKLVHTEWTQELHGKFMDAVGQLGEGMCFPKEILKLMKVPGLSRVQVASHLQKCRNNNWQLPEGQKYQKNNVPAASLYTDPSGQNKPRRFGSMPRLMKNSFILPQEKASEGSKSHFEKEISNYVGHETTTMAPIKNSH
ncbi:two-component response regulator ARR2-like [Olea europaea var. sylvestris]|nr:two-component response regulator ARR2-like [Olea europaea var. sylvestris]